MQVPELLPTIPMFGSDRVAGKPSTTTEQTQGAHTPTRTRAPARQGTPRVSLSSDIHPAHLGARDDTRGSRETCSRTPARREASAGPYVAVQGRRARACKASRARAGGWACARWRLPPSAYIQAISPPAAPRDDTKGSAGAASALRPRRASLQTWGPDGGIAPAAALIPERGRARDIEFLNIRQHIGRRGARATRAATSNKLCCFGPLTQQYAARYWAPATRDSACSLRGHL